MRVDQKLVKDGLARSRTQAQRLIETGVVSARDSLGRPITVKASTRLGDDVQLALTDQAPPFVSRGGYKMQHALTHFNIDPTDLLCLDAGQSTGGFTDCLLRAGAAMVVGADVGHDQLDRELRIDSRVVCLEGVNLRHADRHSLAELISAQPVAAQVRSEGFDCIVADLSFISLRLVLPALARMLSPRGELIALVKPQFELGACALNKRGVVQDLTAARQLESVFSKFSSGCGLSMLGWIDSPIAGASGNHEFLMHLKHNPKEQ